MKDRQYIVLWALLCCIFACDQPVAIFSGPEPSITITNSSGDDFTYSLDNKDHYFAPFPFNVGTLITKQDTVEVMLISKRLEKGQRVSIQPIATIALMDGAGLSEDIIIATPMDEKLKIIQASSFYDFTVEQFSFKQMVEYWYSNRYGLQGMSVKSWSPTSLEDLNIQ